MTCTECRSISATFLMGLKKIDWDGEGGRDELETIGIGTDHLAVQCDATCTQFSQLGLLHDILVEVLRQQT